MNTNVIYTTIIKILTEVLEIDPELISSLNNDTTLKGDLGADSLDLVELVMAIEDDFDMEIDDEQAEACITIGDAVELVCKTKELNGAEYP